MTLAKICKHLEEIKSGITPDEVVSFLKERQIQPEEITDDLLPLFVEHIQSESGEVLPTTKHKSTRKMKGLNSKSQTKTSSSDLAISAGEKIVDVFVTSRETVRQSSVDRILKEYESLHQDIANDVIDAIERLNSKDSKDSTDSTIKLLGGLYRQLLGDVDRTPEILDSIEKNARGLKGCEFQYSDDLARKLKGRREVPVPTGLIDVLTDTQVIEVKYVQYWKHAVGQVQMYSLYYPLHEKRVHLYGSVDPKRLDAICKWTRQIGVTTTWEK